MSVLKISNSILTLSFLLKTCFKYLARSILLVLFNLLIDFRPTGLKCSSNLMFENWSKPNLGDFFTNVSKSISVKLWYKSIINLWLLFLTNFRQLEIELK